MFCDGPQSKEQHMPTEQFVGLITAILLIPTMPLAVYLTLRERESVTELLGLFGDLQSQIHEAERLNSELLDLYKARGIELPMGPKESPFPDLI